MTTHSSLMGDLSPAPEISLTEDITFRQNRVHEACGQARQVLAVLLAGKTGGNVVWAQRHHQREILFPAGLMKVCDPRKFLWVRARTEVDLLWTMEEALRSGVARLAIADFSSLPGLTPVRRLQLAAEASPNPTLGLMLTPEEGGAAGVESRWHFTAEAGGGWRVNRLRARLAPQAEFHLRREGGELVSSPYRKGVMSRA